MKNSMKPRARIIASLGPASRDQTTIRRLIDAGMNVARINFSHGTHEQHAELIDNIRVVSVAANHPIAILLDLQGPKIRIGTLSEGKAELIAGNTLTLTTEAISGDEKIAPVDYHDLPNCVSPGSKILLDDGKIELRVETVGVNTVETVIITGGTLKSHKGVNIPGGDLNIQSFTAKDLADLTFGLQHGGDIVALSFVRSAADIDQLRKQIAAIAPQRADTPIIAKLERPEAIDNLHEIMHAADGVMIARGDLGVEIPPETVPVIQKRIIEMANQHARVVITATQMLESMIADPRPTRAEASDVANAIFDGSDAVMLSGETAVGKYPVETVKMMASIIAQSEAHMQQWGHIDIKPSDDLPHDNARYVTRAAKELVADKDVTAIAVFTQSGRTARLMSKARPAVPILAFTSVQHTYQRLGAYWGVIPALIPHAENVEEMIAHVEAGLLTTISMQPGQEVVIIAGFPIGEKGPANFTLLHTIQGH
ncbi:MAG: pyruvate kinase [Chloroflexi bacterium]|nr:pyruvate kinase [Chloroflexota bacterium]